MPGILFAKLANHAGNVAALSLRQPGTEQHDSLRRVALAEGIQGGENIAVRAHNRRGGVHRRRLQGNRVVEVLNKKDFGEGAASLRAVDQRDTVFNPEAGEDCAERLAGLDRADRQRFIGAENVCHGVLLSATGRGHGFAARWDCRWSDTSGGRG